MKKFLCSIFILSSSILHAQKQMENLDRGVVALRNSEGKVFISWRLLGTEADNTAFNLYRSINGKSEKLNKLPLNKGTNFTDDLSDSVASRSYILKTVTNGKEGLDSKPFVLKPSTKNYLSIPLQTIPGYTPNDASVGDLDGDG